MKSLSYALVALLLFSATATSFAEPEQEIDLTALPSRVSYAIGLNIGNGMKQLEYDLDLDVLIQGIRHGLGDVEPLLSEEQLEQTMMAFQKIMMEKQQAHMAKAGENNLKMGSEFRAQYAKGENVQVTRSGLAYKMIKAGEGASPKSGDTVEIHYTGTLVNGDVFDSSVQRGRPAEFPVDGVIPGFSEAIKLMKVGGKMQVVIPPELGYGDNLQAPGGPNSTLIFDIELLSIKQQ